MSPFLPEYVEQINVHIRTGVTELKLDSGEVVILEFVQGLWFGNRMEKSLIKTNQCQNIGIQLCDYPTNSHGNLVTEASEYMFIPMTMEGSTCGIVRHPPTDYELHECQKIL